MNNHLINDNVNEFLNLYNCCDNLCVCSMGLCFPYCLFGRIYQSANFGSCFSGCCKIFSLHFILNQHLDHKKFLSFLIFRITFI